MWKAELTSSDSIVRTRAHRILTRPRRRAPEPPPKAVEQSLGCRWQGLNSVKNLLEISIGVLQAARLEGKQGQQGLLTLLRRTKEVCMLLESGRRARQDLQ